MHEVRTQLQQERVRADGGGHFAGGLDGDAALLGEGEQRFGGFFGYEGQVDVFSGEGPLVGAAEQEQRSSEVDRPGVDGLEAVDEFADVVVRVVAGHLEECLRDRQRGAELVRGVGCESLLLGDLCFESREHGVEGVGEFAELVAAAFHVDSVRERAGRRPPCGIGDARQGSEHPAGKDPASRETEHQQERQHRDGQLAEVALDGGTTWSERTADAGLV